jgi:hypothetical protein
MLVARSPLIALILATLTPSCALAGSQEAKQ